MDRNAILGTVKSILSNRQMEYGEAKKNMAAIAALWETYLGQKCLGGEDAYLDIRAEDVAQMMMLMKLGRMINGGTSTKDSYLDAIGLTLAAEMGIREE